MKEADDAAREHARFVAHAITKARTSLDDLAREFSAGLLGDELRDATAIVHASRDFVVALMESLRVAEPDTIQRALDGEQRKLASALIKFAQTHLASESVVAAHAARITELEALLAAPDHEVTRRIGETYRTKVHDPLARLLADTATLRKRYESLQTDAIELLGFLTPKSGAAGGFQDRLVALTQAFGDLEASLETGTPKPDALESLTRLCETLSREETQYAAYRELHEHAERTVAEAGKEVAAHRTRLTDAGRAGDTLTAALQELNMELSGVAPDMKSDAERRAHMADALHRLFPEYDAAARRALETVKMNFSRCAGYLDDLKTRATRLRADADFSFAPDASPREKELITFLALAFAASVRIAKQRNRSIIQVVRAVVDAGLANPDERKMLETLARNTERLFAPRSGVFAGTDNRTITSTCLFYADRWQQAISSDAYAALERFWEHRERTLAEKRRAKTTATGESAPPSPPDDVSPPAGPLPLVTIATPPPAVPEPVREPAAEEPLSPVAESLLAGLAAWNGASAHLERNLATLYAACVLADWIHPHQGALFRETAHGLSRRLPPLLAVRTEHGKDTLSALIFVRLTEAGTERGRAMARARGERASELVRRLSLKNFASHSERTRFELQRDSFRK